MTPTLIVELAILGLCTGFLAGLLGLGGGMLMVPFLTIILSRRGYPPQYIVKIAIATSLAAICRAKHGHCAAQEGVRGRVVLPRGIFRNALKRP